MGTTALTVAFQNWMTANQPSNCSDMQSFVKRHLYLLLLQLEHYSLSLPFCEIFFSPCNICRKPPQLVTDTYTWGSIFGAHTLLWSFISFL